MDIQVPPDADPEGIGEASGKDIGGEARVHRKIFGCVCRIEMEGNANRKLRESNSLLLHPYLPD